MPACIFCGTDQSSSPCTLCLTSLQSEILRGKDSQQLWSVCLPRSDYRVSARWRYFGAVRDAILAFKVEKKWGVGIALIRDFLKDARLAELLRWAEGAMPVPSSLWSRLRGRYDLAAVLARILAEEYQLSYWDPPQDLWGAWKKQALRSASERERQSAFYVKKPSQLQKWGPEFFRPKRSLAPRVLLVDDVVTSGRTLVNFAAHFEGIELRCCCLATAIKSLTGDD